MDKRAVGHTVEVEFIPAPVPVAHGCVDGTQTGDGRVVHVNVQRVEPVAELETLGGSVGVDGNSGHISIVPVEVRFAREVWVHAVAVFKVVGSRDDPCAGVPVVGSLSEVHERSVHHDGLASQVVAAMASEVAVFHKAVGVRSAAG